MSFMETQKKQKQETFEDKISTLRADGEWKLRQGKYKQALSSFSAVLDLIHEDKKSFVDRSKCYHRMGEFRNALIDAEASLKDDALLPEGLYQKAEALYSMGELEFALVFYHRAHKIRPQMQEVRLGLQKTEEAIRNHVGSPSSVNLEVKGDLSYLKDKEKREHPIAVIQKLTEDKDHQTSEDSENKKTTKQLLSNFYLHQKFLEKLLKDQDLAKDETKSRERVESIIQNSITSLYNCADFRSQETPISLREKKDRPKLQKSSSTSDKVQFLLGSLDEMDGGSATCSLKKAEDLIKRVQRYSKKVCPIKEEMMCFLHSCIGNASFDLGDVDKALEHHYKDLELAKQCKFQEATSRALGNIGRIYAETEQFPKAIESWEEKIPFVHSDLEKAWLLYEIGCCYLELKHPDKAREYGLRSVAVAEDMSDDKWQLRVRVLLGRSELNLGNFQSSVSHYEKALSLAKQQKDGTAQSKIQIVLNWSTTASASLWNPATERNQRTSIHEDLI
ncbi:PREDICTED: tetratricopeptide repeat protein 25 [Cyprinodon variegatus]|uniref:tetratricopeptide repeat protein 25 n=1 Tax=Cyprinodon variegatus TaxID=28743 RepID=UPI000742AA0B|nr:PREDICTED: tetratricopeptide repeat protein 25 [Cyprinodon variegatus]